MFFNADTCGVEVSVDDERSCKRKWGRGGLQTLWWNMFWRVLEGDVWMRWWRKSWALLNLGWRPSNSAWAGGWWTSVHDDDAASRLVIWRPTMVGGRWWNCLERDYVLRTRGRTENVFPARLPWERQWTLKSRTGCCGTEINERDSHGAGMRNFIGTGNKGKLSFICNKFFLNWKLILKQLLFSRVSLLTSILWYNDHRNVD